MDRDPAAAWVATTTTTTYHVPSAKLPPGYPVDNLGRETLKLYTDGYVVTDLVLPGG